MNTHDDVGRGCNLDTYSVPEISFFIIYIMVWDGEVL